MPIANSFSRIAFGSVTVSVKSAISFSSSGYWMPNASVAFISSSVLRPVKIAATSERLDRITPSKIPTCETKNRARQPF
ncbi:MAG: hypothetical protein F4Y63_09940 [Chloroflexi bacterium]|nr:hypothetical protein [Chloroflexota bacterium]MYF78928.1 hypothetical protein [Chloroflexota bacterium]MYK62139.1 hypothetical protein [Chloroflexota bacterium]